MKKVALRIALVVAAFLSPWAAFAQSIVIPAQTIATSITMDGVQVPVTLEIPAETVVLPVYSLPTGMTYANNVLTVAGSISTPSIALTGAPAIPTSTSGLYLLQLTNGFFHPVPYPYVTPAAPTASIVPHDSSTTKAMQAQGISEPAVTYPTPAH